MTFVALPTLAICCGGTAFGLPVAWVLRETIEASKGAPSPDAAADEYLSALGYNNGDLTPLPTQARLQLSVWALRYRAKRLASACATRLDWTYPNAVAAIWGGANHTTRHGHTGSVLAVCPWLLPDGRTVLTTAGDDRVVRLWDPDTLTPAGELTGHTGPVHAVCPWPLPDGRTVLATAGHDQSVLLWSTIPEPRNTAN